MNQKGCLIRSVTTQECDWLKIDLQKGLEVYKFDGCTYGCIGPSGVAVTLSSDGEFPFFEVPTDSVEWSE